MPQLLNEKVYIEILEDIAEKAEDHLLRKHRNTWNDLVAALDRLKELKNKGQNNGVS